MTCDENYELQYVISALREEFPTMTVEKVRSAVICAKNTMGKGSDKLLSGARDILISESKK